MYLTFLAPANSFDGVSRLAVSAAAVGTYGVNAGGRSTSESKTFESIRYSCEPSV